MKQIKLSDIELIIDSKSARREKISDDEYFAIPGCISNSGMKYILPECDGSAKDYFEGNHKFTTPSLVLGSACHMSVLQPEEFKMAPKTGKPAAKLGQVCDYVIKYRKDGLSIYDSLVSACVAADYYVKGKQYLNKLSEIIRKGLKYYLNAKAYTEDYILLDDKQWETANTCIANIHHDKRIMNLLHPTTIWGDKLPSYNEDAVFMDVIAMINNQAVRLKLKGKLDNWTIDEENKKLVINDLKTSGHFADSFGKKDGSLYTYHYYRQAAFYTDMLAEVMRNEIGFTKDWATEFNFLIVSTIPNYSTAVFKTPESEVQRGREEYQKALKMIAYYTLNGYDEEVEFV